MKNFMNVFCGVVWIVWVVAATVVVATTKVDFAMTMWCAIALITSPVTIPVALKDISEGLGL